MMYSSRVIRHLSIEIKANFSEVTKNFSLQPAISVEITNLANFWLTVGKIIIIWSLQYGHHW